MRSLPRALALFLTAAVAIPVLAADNPCVSGLNPGQRPGPYSALVAVGPQRGTSHCFICEAEDRPVVIVFARTLSDPLGKLLRGVDRAIATHRTAELRAWATFLNEDQTSFDPRVVEWARKQALRSVPLGIFEDAGGPPSYRLNRDADVTVLLSVKQKVVRNFAFRAGELTDEKIAKVLEALPQIVPPGK
jgi:hypothetical protein